MVQLGAVSSIGQIGGLKFDADPLRTLHQDFRLPAGSSIASAAKRGPTLTFTRGSSGTYFDQNGLLLTAGNNVARFDHNPVTGATLGLLIEEARTNILTQTEDFNHADWTKVNGLGVTTDDAVAPDGTTTMDKLIDAGPNFRSLRQPQTGINNNETHCISVFILKDTVAKTTRFSLLRAVFTGGTQINIDLNFATDTGEIEARVATGGGTVVGSGVIDEDDHWRFWLAAKNDATGNTTLTWEINPSIGANADLSIYTAAASGDITVWGAMMEKGDFPTSYIATAAASVTRSADVCSMTDMSWFNPNGGTFLVGASFPHAGGMGGELLDLDDGGNTDRLRLRRDGSENINFSSTHSLDTDGASDGAAIIAAGAAFKVAGACADDDLRAAVDGVLSPADLTAAIPLADPMTTLRLGATIAAVNWNGHIAQLKYWATRKPNGFLQTVTK